ncbi:MAG TPA: cold shock domain-containing protein [candidate division Zixibacteria bacterium]|nr:cold shock domain-containing protein [candidate division Zixibacteria bacterium]
MSKGKVKYFNDLRGWGFISPEERDQDVYVHYTAINMDGYKTLREGQEVLFDASQTSAGYLQANNVVVCN